MPACDRKSVPGTVNLAPEVLFVFLGRKFDYPSSSTPENRPRKIKQHLGARLHSRPNVNYLPNVLLFLSCKSVIPPIPVLKSDPFKPGGQGVFRDLAWSWSGHNFGRDSWKWRNFGRDTWYQRWSYKGLVLALI